MAGLTLGAVTLDTGALVALERNRRDMVRLVETAIGSNRPVHVPGNVLAEWWRGHTDRREYLRNVLVIKDVDDEIATLAGEALASMKRKRGEGDRVTIDATVMATAALNGVNQSASSIPATAASR